MSSFALQKATYYYYSLLNPGEQKLYSKVLYAILNHVSRVELQQKLQPETLKKIVSYIRYDRPDIFWLGREFHYRYQKEVVLSLELEYTMTVQTKNATVRQIEASRFYNELNSLLQSKSSSLEKALAAYEYIIRHTDYDKVAADRIYEPRYGYASILCGPVLLGKAVCSGYAKTFQYFMNKHDILCTYVSGSTKKGDHAWNLIKLYGSYYYIDATWGDPVFTNDTKKDPNYVCYDYFCFTTEALKQTHGAKIAEKMPICTDTRCNYYVYFGMLESAYSVGNVAKHIVDAKKQGKSAVIKYTNEAAYSLAVKKLFSQSELFQALKIANRYNRTIPTSGQIQYQIDPAGRQITILI